MAEPNLNQYGRAFARIMHSLAVKHHDQLFTEPYRGAFICIPEAANTKSFLQSALRHDASTVDLLKRFIVMRTTRAHGHHGAHANLHGQVCILSDTNHGGKGVVKMSDGSVMHSEPVAAVYDYAFLSQQDLGHRAE